MAEMMRAAVFEGEGRLVVKDVPKPVCSKPDSVLLRVEAAGICGTDLQIISVPQKYPGEPNTILGHEYCGEVVEVGSEVFHVKPGDRVVIDPNITCGVCRSCRQGLPNMCEHIVALGVQLNGGFAEYNVAPGKAVHKMSQEVSPEKGIFSEPISCILNPAMRVAFIPGMTVAIFGAGPIGQLFIQYYRATSASLIIAVEPSPYRAKAALASGADIVIDPGKDDPAEKIQEISGGGTDLAIDAVGFVLNKALGCVHKGGNVLAIGISQVPGENIQQSALTINEKTIVGTFIANLTFYPAIRIIEHDIFCLDTLVTHRIPLEDIKSGMELMESGECLKVIVCP